MTKTLTQARLREVLMYDPENGLFSWRIATNGRRYVGERAGHKNPYGYVQIKVDRVMYRAHRLAWLYMTGCWPIEEQIDHLNGVRDDNRWTNLREVPRTMNNQNQRRAMKNNRSSFLLGVTRRNEGGGFQARIRVDGKERRLGTFVTALEAHAAYVAAKRVLHPGCMI